MTQQPTYGSHNPYPLSQMQTELVWEGKYDECGDREASVAENRGEEDIAEYAMPMQKIYERLNITPQQLKDFCQRWQLSELALFGSALQKDFRQDGDDPSDVDFLFSYLPDTNMSLLRRARMKIELEALCQRSVDLVMTTEVMASHNLNRRNRILESTRLIYVQR
jgi:predicted nucleotidyltransferase